MQIRIYSVGEQRTLEVISVSRTARLAQSFLEPPGGSLLGRGVSGGFWCVWCG